MMKIIRFSKLSKRTLVRPLPPKRPMFMSSFSKVPRSAFRVSRLLRKICVLKLDQTNICLTSTGWKHKHILGQADVFGQVTNTKIIREHTPSNSQDLPEYDFVKKYPKRSKEFKSFSFWNDCRTNTGLSFMGGNQWQNSGQQPSGHPWASN